MNHLEEILMSKLICLKTKADIQNISHVDTSSSALKSNLASLKTEADILDIDKLVPVLADLSKLSSLVKNDAVKKSCF